MTTKKRTLSGTMNGVSERFGVLVIDDEEGCRVTLETLCSKVRCENQAINIHSCANLMAGFEVLANSRIQVILVDKDLLNADGQMENGIEAIPELRLLAQNAVIFVVTGSNNPDDIVKAMNLGADDYFVKGESEEIIPVKIEAALLTAKTRAEASRLSSRPKEHIPDLVGNSLAIRTIRTQIPALSENEWPVLILGETGSGKSTVARHIHEARKAFLDAGDAPFVSLNMAVLDPQTAVSELFGHVKGSFTGAHVDKVGLVEHADGGTLFLDEIAEASLEVQAKLLTAIEQKKFRRLGGNKDRYSSFKLVCATNQNLEDLVRQKKFREDLYMRIKCFDVQLPPVRERPEDIAALVKSLLPAISKKSLKVVSLADIPEDFIDHLSTKELRGNIRELEYALIQLISLVPRDRKGQPLLKRWRRIPAFRGEPMGRAKDHVEGKITFEELCERSIDVSTLGSHSLDDAVERFSKIMVQEGLKMIGNQTEVAKLLGISKTRISNLVHKFGLRAAVKGVKRKNVRSGKDGASCSPIH